MNSENTGSSAGLSLEIDGKTYRLELSAAGPDGSWLASIEGRTVQIEARLVPPGILSLIIDGRSYRCVSDEGPLETAIHLGGKRYLFAIDDPRSLAARRRKVGPSSGVQIVKAPMPGRIVRLMAAVGDQIDTHQAVIVIEAMKMQNELKAVRPGKVVEVRVEAGAAVTAGQVLLLLE